MAEPNTPFHPEEPVPSWDALQWFFEGMSLLNSPALQKGAATAWRCDWTRVDDRDELVGALAKAEKEHLADIEAGVSLAATPCDPDLAGISPEALGFLRLRAETCSAFLWMLCGRGFTLFAVPEATWQEAVQWMLVTWWEEHGRELAADHMIADRFGRD